MIVNYWACTFEILSPVAVLFKIGEKSEETVCIIQLPQNIAAMFKKKKVVSSAPQSVFGNFVPAV